MGRAPCCDKANVKKGPWSPEEDDKLKAYIEQNGTGGNWIALPQKIGLKRCGKSCRLRWLNYLRPNIKHGGFSEEEDNIICSLYISIGSRWSIIAAQLPGRTDNDIKNYWNTRLKKKLLGKQRKEQQARRSNHIAPVIINQQQTPYWPEIPPSTAAPTVLPVMTCGSQEQGQESLKSLLIKLGGRFSNYNNQESLMNNTINYPLDGSSSSMNMLSSSSMTSGDSPISQLPNADYTVNTAMFQGLDGYSAELEELLLCSNNHQQLQGLESLYAADMTAASGGRHVATSSDSGGFYWGNITSSLQGCPQLVSEFETCLQSLPKDHSSYEVSSYFTSQ